MGGAPMQDRTSYITAAELQDRLSKKNNLGSTPENQRTPLVPGKDHRSRHPRR
jgi:hypothetical protein